MRPSSVLSLAFLWTILGLVGGVIAPETYDIDVLGVLLIPSTFFLFILLMAVAPSYLKKRNKTAVEAAHFFASYEKNYQYSGLIFFCAGVGLFLALPFACHPNLDVATINILLGVGIWLAYRIRDAIQV